MFGLMSHVQHAAILNITARTDLYRVDIAADGNQRPDTDVIGQLNVADHHAGRVDHYALTQFWRVMKIRTHCIGHGNSLTSGSYLPAILDVGGGITTN
ncbi:hypothetical protein D3C71_1954760 [compost metagenome]